MKRPNQVLLLASLYFSHSSGRRVPSLREGNAGNCVGLQSCRPRCIGFRLDRQASKRECVYSRGIFLQDDDDAPWNMERMHILNCETNGSCINDLCSEELRQDLAVRVREMGVHAYYTTVIDLPAERNQFTFCSIYSCPKDECSLPEQMGSDIKLDFRRASNGVPVSDPLLVVRFVMKDTFRGTPILLGREKVNRYGLVHVEWMDDPTGCREGLFSPYAPVAPLENPHVVSHGAELNQTSFCQGEDYDPGPLPQAETPPASETTPRSPVERSQIQGLLTFFHATQMSTTLSRPHHNWFQTDDHCEFTGVRCNEDGLVTDIELQGKELSGSLPSGLESLSYLQNLEVGSNRIAGSIPAELSELSRLTVLDISENQITGTIPAELSALPELRRLLVQDNRLAGEIPTELCHLERFASLDISHNEGMYGTIPDCIGELPLTNFRVEDVGLVGTVPQGLCDPQRDMNGVRPNRFGCDAIACPAGFYESSRGRQTRRSSPCVQCDISSNVIGSTTCMQVQSGNTNGRTGAPAAFPPLDTSPTVSNSLHLESSSPSTTSSSEATLDPSQSPSSPPWIPATVNSSVVPSDYPTEFPSDHPTTEEARVQSSEAPTDLPTMTSSTDPGGEEVLFLPESAKIRVWFRHVSTSMETQDEIKVFESLTLLFLQEHLDESSTAQIHSLEVISQGLVSLPTSSESFTPVLLIPEQARDRQLIRTDGFFLEVEVIVHGRRRVFVDGRASMSLGETVVSILTTHYDEYVSASLSNKLNRFQPSGANRGASGINWALLGSALGLSILAMVLVISLRYAVCLRRGDTYEHSMERHMVVFRNKQGEEGEDEVSEESDGGWNSSGDSGSSRVAREDAVSIWSNEEVGNCWSVAANEGCSFSCTEPAFHQTLVNGAEEEIVSYHSLEEDGIKTTAQLMI